MAEAERNNGHQIQAANIRANLSLVARRRGDLDAALKLLMDAYNAIMNLAATMKNEWWCKNRELDEVKKMLNNSDVLVGALDRSGELSGFARVLTDYT